MPSRATPGAGDLDRRIVIERNAPGAANAMNEAAPVWSPFITVWAARDDQRLARDGEGEAAGQITGSLTSRFTIRSSVKSRTVTTADRISHDGRLWQIKNVRETAAGRDRFIEIAASVEND